MKTVIRKTGGATLSSPHKRRFLFLLFLLFLLGGMALTACATGGQTVFVNLSYLKGEKKPSSSLPSVAVAPFEDERHTKELLGRRIYLSGSEDKVQAAVSSVGSAVAEALAEALRTQAVAVVPLSPLSEEPTATGLDYLIRGKIVDLWAEAISHPVKTRISVRMQLSIEVKNLRKGTMTTHTVKSESTPVVVFFSVSAFQKAINETLTEGIDRLVADLLPLFQKA